MKSQKIERMIATSLASLGIAAAAGFYSGNIENNMYSENKNSSTIESTIPVESMTKENTLSYAEDEDTCQNSKTTNYDIERRLESEENYITSLPSIPGDGFKRHSVRSGESLTRIAQIHSGIEGENGELYEFIDEIRESNNFSRLDYGDVIRIPVESNDDSDILRYEEMNREQRIDFFRDRTIDRSYDYLEEILEISEYKGIDARIPMAIATVESGFNDIADSSMGASGMWQLMPVYHGEHNSTRDALSTSIDFILNIYHDFIEIHEGNELAALTSTVAAYNVGPNRVKAWIDEERWDGEDPQTVPRNGNDEIGYSFETRNYVSKVVHDTLHERYNLDLGD